MKVTLIQQTPNPIQTIAQIASICYDSDPKNPSRLVERLYIEGHHSVFEHIYFTFKVEGISRACSHQLVRHRHCSFTQRSQRYCPEDGFAYVMPQSVEDADAVEKYAEFIDTVAAQYRELVALGVPKEDARMVLPNACATSLYVSFNLREMIHMCNERLCNKAQWEIREMMEKMVALVDPDLQYMLVPTCESGRMLCYKPCWG